MKIGGASIPNHLTMFLELIQIDVVYRYENKMRLDYPIASDERVT